MKNYSKHGLLTLFVMLFGFYSNAQVKSDFKKDVDFTKYKTYSFAGWQNGSDKQLTEFDKERILDALKSEFNARRMTLVKSGADAMIVLFVVLDKKTSTTAYTNYMGGLGYGPRWGWGMGMSGATTTYTESDYLEGTLVVDMYDNSGKHLLWQGVITTEVQENPEKRDKTIPRKIKRLMREYPIPVGR